MHPHTKEDNGPANPYTYPQPVLLQTGLHPGSEFNRRGQARTLTQLCTAGEDATGGPFSKQAAQLGLRSRILAGDGVCSDKLPDLAGVGAERVVCSQPGTPPEKMPGGNQFKAKYQKRFGQGMEIYAPFTYDAVYIVTDAMRRANSTDPAKILAAMPSTDYQGVTGETTFDQKGDLKHGVISIYSYKNGKKTFLDEVKM